MKLELDKVVGSILAGVNLRIDSGLCVIVGNDDDGASELVRIAAGLERPKSGAVRLDGRDPFRKPAARARIGVMMGNEEAWIGSTVGAAIANAAALRSGWPSMDPLPVLGVRGWSDRRMRDLSAAERRTLAFACAVGLPPPVLLVLYEPFDLAEIGGDAVTTMLSRHRDAGSVVLAVTSSALSAARLSPEVVLLERGRLARGPTEALPLALAPGISPDLIVQTDSPRRLAQALGAEGAVVAASFDEERRPGELVVRGPEPEAVARAVVRAARASGIALGAFGFRSQPLEVVRAATAGLVRAAYDGAYRNARKREPAAPERAS